MAFRLLNGNSNYVGCNAMPSQNESVTVLLRKWSGGDETALSELLPLVYEQLHRLAAGCMRGERAQHTLRATALVHEAYLRLVDADVDLRDRVQFYAVAARLMRRILVDHARSLNSDKRGNRPEKLPFDEVLYVGPKVDASVLALDDSLKSLALRDQRKSDIVEMIYFGGLTYEETAIALNTSESTIHRELKMAKAWLYSELANDKSIPEASR
jgi:RNA polymerase sigma factor (TIGR02999 family)